MRISKFPPSRWKKYYWESTTFPRISILPVVKVRSSGSVGWWFTAWAWCWHNCPKRCKMLRRSKQAIRPRQNASSYLQNSQIAWTFLRTVLNNKGTKRCTSKYFPFGGLKDVTCLQMFQYWTLTGLRVPTALSYRKWLSYYK